MTEKLEKQLVEDFPFLKKTYPFYGEGDIEIIKMLTSSIITLKKKQSGQSTNKG